MLPRKYRLVGQRRFKLIAERGGAFFLKEMGLKCLKNNLVNSRFAFIISIQVDKKAVVRNKIKRRLRQIIYQEIKKIKPGFDVLILTRPAIKNLTFEELRERLGQLLRRSTLL